VTVPSLEEYAARYSVAKLEREDGILLITLHHDGQDVVWNPVTHQQITHLLGDVAADPDNKVVILTGTGDTFIHHHRAPDDRSQMPSQAQIHYNVPKLLLNHLDIQAPMVAAINGPATVHAELGLLCDIVLASDDAVFQDAAHFPAGLVPGDGVQLVWPMLLGLNRGRYFLLTGQKLSASEALALGVVNEVLPRGELVPRAWEVARMLAEKPEFTRRLTRQAILQDLKRAVLDNVRLGMTLEALAMTEYLPSLSEPEDEP
jgi:enoyl-CoA hydratase/carnithine racemase